MKILREVHLRFLKQIPNFRSMNMTTMKQCHLAKQLKLTVIVVVWWKKQRLLKLLLSNVLLRKVKLYCICRSTDGESFMIECDNCDEWFHGDCVSISREESQMVDKYYCPNCSGIVI